MAIPLNALRSAKPTVDKDTDESGQTMSVPQHEVYQDASFGPFRCDNCEHFVAPNQCNHDYIVKNYGPTVEPAACCDFFDSLSKEE